MAKLFPKINSASRVQKLAALSFFSSIFILGAKWWAYFLTHSMTLKTDAYEGIVNVVASGIALTAVRYANQPADKDHPYGHGKMEYFSAGFEGGLIFLAACLIGYDSIMAFFHPPVLSKLDQGLIINVLAGLLNGALGFLLLWNGRKLKSEALRADGLHLLSDFATTVVVLFGLGAVLYFKILWLDSLIALLMGFYLAWTGFKLIRKSILHLIDTQDEGQRLSLAHAIIHYPGPEIVAVHNLRSLQVGATNHVDLHIVVPEFYDVKKAHDLVQIFCQTIMQQSGVDGETHAHIDPCLQQYCSSCRLGTSPGETPCPVRQQNFSNEPTLESILEYRYHDKV